jgi:tetratricopeptide (TPR) repeat protein
MDSTKRKNTVYSIGRRVPANITNNLVCAQEHYIRGEFKEAVGLLTTIIKAVPTLAVAYYTLGLIYEEVKNYLQALKFYLLAANHSHKHSHFWNKVFKIIQQSKI